MGQVEYRKSSIRGMLENIYHFEKLKERGNTDAIIALVDLEQAVNNCNFTDCQKQVYHNRYILQYTPDETAKRLRMSRQNVVQHECRIVNKIFAAINGEV